MQNNRKTLGTRASHLSKTWPDWAHYDMTDVHCLITSCRLSCPLPLPHVYVHIHIMHRRAAQNVHMCLQDESLPNLTGVCSRGARITEFQTQVDWHNNRVEPEGGGLTAYNTISCCMYYWSFETAAETSNINFKTTAADKFKPATSQLCLKWNHGRY